VVWSGQVAGEEEGRGMLLSEDLMATALVGMLLFSCLRDTYRCMLYVEYSGADVPIVSLSLTHSRTHTHTHTHTTERQANARAEGAHPSASMERELIRILSPPSLSLMLSLLLSLLLDLPLPNNFPLSVLLLLRNARGSWRGGVASV